jgi:hypothetical protein
MGDMERLLAMLCCHSPRGSSGSSFTFDQANENYGASYLALALLRARVPRKEFLHRADSNFDRMTKRLDHTTKDGGPNAQKID